MSRPLRFLDRFYWGSGLADDLPALTYYLLVSLVPFSFGLVVIGTLVLGDDLSPATLTGVVGRLLPPDARSIVIDTVESTRANSPLLLLVSIFAMLWTSSGAIGVVERALARITRARRYPPAIGKARNLGLGGLLALLLVGATAAGIATSGALERSGADAWVGTTISLLHIFGSIILCACVYRYVTAERIPWRDALRGGVVGGVLLQLTPVVVAVYVRSTHPSVEQFFLALALLVLVCSLLAFALLVGAGVAARAGRRRVADAWLSRELKRRIATGPPTARAWADGLEIRVRQLVDQYRLHRLEPTPDDTTLSLVAEDPDGRVRLVVSPEPMSPWDDERLPRLIHFDTYACVYRIAHKPAAPDWPAIGGALVSMAEAPLPRRSWAPGLLAAIEKHALRLDADLVAVALAQPLVWVPGTACEWSGATYLRPNPLSAPSGWAAAWTWWCLGGDEDDWRGLVEIDGSVEAWRWIVPLVGDAPPIIDWPSSGSRILERCL